MLTILPVILCDYGVIIPYSFKRYRYSTLYNPSLDIRRNLRQDKPSNLTSFHAYYKINKIKKLCTADITPSNVICVECDGFTRDKNKDQTCRGIGRFLRETHFDFINDKCITSGLWLKLTHDLHGNCTQNESYIFV